MKWWLKNQSANSHLKSVFEIPENAFKKECRHSIWLDQDMILSKRNANTAFDYIKKWCNKEYLCNSFILNLTGRK